MILGWPRNLYDSYEIDGVPGDFSAAPNGIEVSTDAFHTAFMSYVRE